MLATSLQSDIQLLSSELKQGVCRDILAQIDSIHLQLLRSSYPARPYTAKALSKLLSLDEPTKLEILENLTRWNAILSSTDPLSERVNDVVFAEKALKFFRFSAKGFKWSTVARNEIIEIYNTEGVQLYRSLNFFSLCNYSLLDLCVNKWFELWERPNSTIEAMSTVVEQVLSGKKTDYDANIAPHLVRETYDDGMTEPFAPHAAIVTFRKIFPVFGLDEREIMGFVTTSTGELVSKGNDIKTLGFI